MGFFLREVLLFDNFRKFCIIHSAESSILLSVVHSAQFQSLQLTALEQQLAFTNEIVLKILSRDLLKVSPGGSLGKANSL